ncbi:MAG TPA: VWD domain-containing protein [Acidimicrobiales bacterium]|nr:VWD domain-containing protein [Acidimicrobiales bacterium]
MPARASPAPAHVAAAWTGAVVRAPANDPTDGDFEAIFTPVFVPVAAVEAPTSRLAGAFKSLNQLFGVQTRFDEDVVALCISLDRAKEAAVAGDQLWLGRQADSSAQYALEAFSILKEFPSLNAAVESAFVADGFALKVTPKQFAAGQTYLAQHGLSPELTHVLGVAAGTLRPQTSAEVKALSALLLDPTIFEQAIARASPTSMDLPAVLDALTSAEDRAAVAFQSYANHILHPTTTKNAQFRGLANACSSCEEQEPTSWSEVAENEHHLTQFAEGVEAAAKQASSFFGQLGNSGAAEGLEHAAEGAETGGQIAGYAFAAAAFWAASDAFGMPGGGGGGGTGYTDGDPHLQALNGDDYDFQAAGEFTLVRSGDGLDVQVRQQPAYGSDTVAWDTAVAMLVVGKRVEIDPGAPLRVLVDGHRVQLRGSVPLRLSGGEVYLDHEGDVIVKWPDGSEADVYTDFLGENVTFTSAPYLVGKLTGLLTADATPEVKPGVTSTKEVLIGGNGKRYTFDASTKSGFLTLYRDFAPSWQITQAESLFTYSPGTSTRSYVLKDFPSREYNLASISPGRLAALKSICRKAGITNEALLDDCVLDAGATGKDYKVIAQATARVETLVNAAAPGPVLKVVPPTTAIGFAEASNLSFPGHSGTVLHGVSCPTGSSCVAVGQDLGNYAGANGTIEISDTGAGWTPAPVAVPSPPPAHADDILSSVSCWAPGACAAVGDYETTSNGTVPLVETETGSTWQPAANVALPAGANGTGPVLNGVACTNAGTCLAVGNYGDISVPEAMGVLSTGGQWGQGAEAVEIRQPSGPGGNPRLNAVSCAGTWCLAAGEYSKSFYVRPGMAVAESGGHFRPAVQVKAPASNPTFIETTLSGVSCSGPGTCAISGSYLNPKSDFVQAMVASEVNGAWQTSVGIELPANADATGTSSLNGIWCHDVGGLAPQLAPNCVAVGSYVDNAGVTRPMYVDESDSHWAQAVELAVPAGDGSVTLYGVACSPGGVCAAVGDTQHGDGIVALSTATHVVTRTVNPSR